METKAEVWIPLTQGRVAVIDFDDFEKVRGMKWYAHKERRRFYACREDCATGKRVYLHRLLIAGSPGLQVNHINGDGLDNRQENLQVCTLQQNSFAHQHKRKNTSSKYRGVSWDNQNERWRANIKLNGKLIFLGRFEEELYAANAYDTAAIKYFGEYAAPNFPKQSTVEV